MIRTPLRPLATVLAARSEGENPDAIERENLRARHEADRDAARQRAEGRLLVLGIAFLCAFAMVGLKMSLLAASDPAEPRAAASGAQIVAARADITDRNGRILATNLTTHSLYAQPPQMIDPVRAARELIGIFPDLDHDRLVRQFTGKRKFIWIKRRISPEQQQAVFDIGDPGLLFGPREMRLYPNGRLASHVLGGAGFGREGVSSAEVIGVAGVEKALDESLRDPGRGDVPLTLSLDLTVQAAVERVLAGGMRLMNAKGAAAVLMDIHTGEVISLASLPDFDPNDRPSPLVAGDPADSPLFNRAVQGVYELGSTFKIFAAAQGIEERLVSRSTMIDITGPLTWGRHKIRDFRNYGKALTVEDVIVKSSNIGTARIAMMIGPERQQDFLSALGLFAPTPVEIIEATGARPLLPKKWSEIHTMTVSYGHGLSASPMHLAAAYASLLNGGLKVTPTLLKREEYVPGPRVVSEDTSRQAREMLRQVVSRGTASLGEVAGYRVGGKTGTADKPRPQGGYYEDKVIATFATVFPSDDPAYVLVVTLDEAVETSGKEPRRTAGWTAVPVAAEVIRRVAPLLGLAPAVEPALGSGVTLARN
ncbi:MAG: penicillin-binding protein 2 [Silicimonas sp.]|nr:penicillin-binding protein 2 [Silicimonas sp.]NNL35405.1 penicillin-binding protein 2 [Silicimonas sp.]